MNAREKLREWRRKNRVSAVALAGILKCSRGFVYELEMNYSGNNTLPGLALAQEIQKATKIPATAWDRLAAVKHHRPTKPRAA